MRIFYSCRFSTAETAVRAQHRGNIGMNWPLSATMESWRPYRGFQKHKTNTILSKVHLNSRYHNYCYVILNCWSSELKGQRATYLIDRTGN